MLNRIKDSPLLARVVPFGVFALLTLGQDWFGDASQYWIYASKTGIGIWLLWLVRPKIEEMQWNLSWPAVITGIGVFWLWVGLEGYYPKISYGAGTFNPNRTFGAHSAPAYIFISVRFIGSSLVVPLIEEIFYRSFLYRFIRRSNFLELPLGQFDRKSFLLTAAIFGIGHYEWLPGILCAFAYQALVCRKRRLGDAVTAHAITNCLLGLWVISRNAWHFW